MLEVVIRSNHDPPPLTRGSQVFLGAPPGNPPGAGGLSWWGANAMVGAGLAP